MLLTEGVFRLYHVDRNGDQTKQHIAKTLSMLTHNVLTERVVRLQHLYQKGDQAKYYIAKHVSMLIHNVIGH